MLLWGLQPPGELQTSKANNVKNRNLVQRDRLVYCAPHGPMHVLKYMEGHMLILILTPIKNKVSSERERPGGGGGGGGGAEKEFW